MVHVKRNVRVVDCDRVGLHRDRAGLHRGPGVVLARVEENVPRECRLARYHPCSPRSRLVRSLNVLGSSFVLRSDHGPGDLFGGVCHCAREPRRRRPRLGRLIRASGRLRVWASFHGDWEHPLGQMNPIRGRPDQVPRPRIQQSHRRLRVHRCGVRP